MMERTVLCLVISLTAVLAAHAEGLAQKDLTKITVNPKAYSGGSFISKVEPDRLTLFCETCTEMTVVDVQFSKSFDGTEQRYRSGETTIEKMEGLCQAKEPECKMERAEVGTAVGWQTHYPIAGGAGSTVVLFQDGDVLTIRALAPKPATASKNARIALKEIASQIVGK